VQRPAIVPGGKFALGLARLGQRPLAGDRCDRIKPSPRPFQAR